MVWHDDSWRNSYDAWKLATPPEYEWPADRCEDCGSRDCPRLDGGDGCCIMCADTGWMLADDDEHAVPCSECSGEVENDYDERDDDEANPDALLLQLRG